MHDIFSYGISYPYCCNILKLLFMVLLILREKTGIWKCRQTHGVGQWSEVWIWAQSPESLKRCMEFKAGQSLDRPPWTKMMKCEYHWSRCKQRLIVGSTSGLGTGVGDLFMWRLEFKGKKCEHLETEALGSLPLTKYPLRGKVLALYKCSVPLICLLLHNALNPSRAAPAFPKLPGHLVSVYISSVRSQ